MCGIYFEPKITIDGLFGVAALTISLIALNKQWRSPARLDIFQAPVSIEYKTTNSASQRVLHTKFHVSNVGDATATLLSVSCEDLRVGKTTIQGYIEEKDKVDTLVPGAETGRVYVTIFDEAPFKKRRAELKLPLDVTVNCSFRDGRGGLSTHKEVIKVDLSGQVHDDQTP